MPGDLVAILNEGDRRRLDQMHGARRRQEFIAGRLLLRHGLRHRYPEASSQWHLHAPKDAPPVLVSENPDVQPPAISIAHSAGLVVCAMARVSRLGVDVERCRTGRPNLLGAPEVVLHPIELAEMTGAGDAARLRCFYESWVLKEALGKALGCGLSLGLQSFAFRSARLVAQPDAWDAAGENWRFLLREIGPDALVGLAWTASSEMAADEVPVHWVSRHELL